MLWPTPPHFLPPHHPHQSLETTVLFSVVVPLFFFNHHCFSSGTGLSHPFLLIFRNIWNLLPHSFFFFLCISCPNFCFQIHIKSHNYQKTGYSANTFIIRHICDSGWENVAYIRTLCFHLWPQLLVTLRHGILNSFKTKRTLLHKICF